VTDVGVVAIGRNEGDRLRRCLDSLAGRGLTVVYVDSGSDDDSPALAEAAGAEVVALDMSRPFTAARARNAGFERLRAVAPGVRYVQFLDGDCEMDGGWLARAVGALEAHPRAAVAFGLRREQFPDRSVYNRIADIEWNVPIGRTSGDGGVVEAQSCGGDALMRVEALRAVGGYDPTVPVCEEPELCQRLRDAGWSVLRLDAGMTRHDADLLRFRQWAKRVCRTGYGGLDFTARFGRRADNPFRRQVNSARLWGLGWPLAFAGGTALAATLGGPVAGWSAAGLLLAVLPAQAIRIARKTRARAGSARAALAYGALTVVSKWVQLYGQALYLRDRLAGRHARLIEYKRDASPDTCPSQGKDAPVPAHGRS
jgi:GT2 family glycosyltransferase